MHKFTGLVLTGVTQKVHLSLSEWNKIKKNSLSPNSQNFQHADVHCAQHFPNVSDHGAGVGGGGEGEREATNCRNVFSLQQSLGNAAPDYKHLEDMDTILFFFITLRP